MYPFNGALSNLQFSLHYLRRRSRRSVWSFCTYLNSGTHRSFHSIRSCQSLPIRRCIINNKFDAGSSIIPRINDVLERLICVAQNIDVQDDTGSNNVPLTPVRTSVIQLFLIFASILNNITSTFPFTFQNEHLRNKMKIKYNHSYV